MTRSDGDHDDDFRRLVGLHSHAVELLLMGLERDPATREDLWSETFTIAYVRFDQIDGLSDDGVRGWLLRTARFVTANSARRAMTRSKATGRLLAEQPQPAPSAEDAYFEAASAATENEQAMVEVAWSSLSGPHREVLTMDALGYDGPAIANALGISPLATRSRLLRARRAFVRACQQPEASLR